MQQKPFAESCVENREPIFAALEPRVASSRSLLEIGSGTGQHAVYFAPRLAHLTWQTSDQSDQHPGIRAWLDEAALDNVLAPLALDVLKDPWPAGPFDAAFSANTAHIHGWRGRCAEPVARATTATWWLAKATAAMTSICTLDSQSTA